MSRSSIFSFESFEGFKPRLPIGFLAAAALVLCVELGVRLAPDTWLIAPYSRLGFRGFMEHKVLSNFDAPQVVIFGTSRSADAIVPTLVDEALNFDNPANGAVNLSIFGSRTSDWLDLYRRNAKLHHCKVVVVVVDEWMFSSGVGNDDEFNLDAPLADRWNYARPGEMPLIDESPAQHEKRLADMRDNLQVKRNQLLADWAFNMRLKLNYLPMAVLESLHLGKRKQPVYDSFHMVRSTTLESGEATKDPRNFHERIRNFYKYFDTHPVYLQHVEALARLVKEDGGRMIIVHLPNKRSYQQEVDTLVVKAAKGLDGEQEEREAKAGVNDAVADFPVRLAYEQHVRVTRELANRIGVPFYYYKYPEELNLTDNDYVDYCHLSKKGADICTQAIVGLIQKELLQK